MLITEKNILNLDWRFYISRNVQMWHDSLYIIYGTKGCKKYDLPSLIHTRIHRNSVNTDFYCLHEGKYNRDKSAEKLEKMLQNPKYIIFLKKEFKKDCTKLIKISKSTLSIYNSLKKFFEFYGLCAPMLEITSLASKILTNRAINLLKNYKEKDAILAFYSSPKQLSPVQKLDKELDKLPPNLKNIEAVVERLWKKYQWIPVNFVGEPWSKEDFIGKIKNHKKTEKKNFSKPKEKITPELKQILHLLSEIAFLNEYRKAAFSQACFNIRPILNKIALTNNLNGWKDLNSLSHDEILDLLKTGNTYQTQLIKKSGKLRAIYVTTGTDKYSFLSDKLINKFENKFGLRADGLKQAEGTPANKGKITGMAKVISGPEEFHKFKTGDILIAQMTSVDFLPIMKMAGAFVTNEGGMACHAAIVARELNIPCIIGTKIATKIFKDGDLVEVDAEKGIVRKIK